MFCSTVTITIFIIIIFYLIAMTSQGSWVRREVGAAHHEDPSILGMDLDFQRSHGKMYVGARQKEMISQQIENDVQVKQLLPFPAFHVVCMCVAIVQ